MKRRGFTLIELMVVIAIIIILAAIAIPNYLSMTARAKRSRVASDFAAIATALETYRTDWNQYPPATAAVQIAGTGIVFTSGPAQELTGTGTPGVNKGTTAAGETAPIQYMTSNILTSMVNPYSTTNTDQYKYIAGASTALGSGNTTPQHWMLSAVTVAGGSGSVFLSRTDEATAVSGPSTIGTLPSD